MTELIALLPHSIYYRPTTTAHNVTRKHKKRRNTIERKRLEKGPGKFRCWLPMRSGIETKSFRQSIQFRQIWRRQTFIVLECSLDGNFGAWSSDASTDVKTSQIASLKLMTSRWRDIVESMNRGRSSLSPGNVNHRAKMFSLFAIPRVMFID